MESNENKDIRVVELFAGVGGFRLGLEDVPGDRFRTVWANQWEPGQAGQWAYKCYVSHFGDGTPCVNEDVATVLDQVPEHDLLCGGFPCQDYSVAHTGAKGIEGKKGVLWWSIEEIVRRRRPKYILLENVDRLLKSPAKQRGRDFGIMLKCLDGLGYAVEWRVVNAADYGNAQKRRRTFIFACHESTGQYRAMGAAARSGGPDHAWLTGEGFFAGAFPVQSCAVPGKEAQADLGQYADLVDMTARFQAAFYNAGTMLDGKVHTAELVPAGTGCRTLGEVLSGTPVDGKYFLSDDEIPKWAYLKSAKRVERVSRTGFAYSFSEGAMSFPDPLDRPARTMLTDEGSLNRSSHAVFDPHTGRMRRLTPEECERINGFPTGWTGTGMPERQRYFTMGNALVVPLVTAMGNRLLEIM